MHNYVWVRQQGVMMGEKLVGAHQAIQCGLAKVTARTIPPPPISLCCRTQLRTSNRVRTLDLGDIVAHIKCRKEGGFSWTS